MLGKGETSVQRIELVLKKLGNEIIYIFYWNFKKKYLGLMKVNVFEVDIANFIQLRLQLRLHSGYKSIKCVLNRLIRCDR